MQKNQSPKFSTKVTLGNKRSSFIIKLSTNSRIDPHQNSGDERIERCV